MKTHNAIIYHCLFCGGVMHAEPEAQPPQCCGRAMVKAAAETICEADADESEEEKRSHCEAPPAATETRLKAR